MWLHPKQINGHLERFERSSVACNHGQVVVVNRDLNRTTEAGVADHAHPVALA